jgi:hypothetical protein
MQTKKYLWLNNKVMQTVEANTRNETKKFFEEVKYFNQQQSTLPTTCKDFANNVISQTEQVLKRWKEYFYNILNPKEALSTSVCITKSSSENYEVSSPMCNKICTIINKLKSNKAAGIDNIPLEFIKSGGRTSKHKLYTLILKIWDKEQLPTQWNEGNICPICKKGDRLKCNNYLILHIKYLLYY